MGICIPGGAGVITVKRATKTLTFTGAAGAGAVGTVALFAVTGRVVVDGVIPFCTSDLVSAGEGTIFLGTADNPTLLLDPTIPTIIHDGEVWIDDTHAIAITDGIPLYHSRALGKGALLQDDDILLTIDTDNVTGGALIVDLIFMPLSDDANIVAA